MALVEEKIVFEEEDGTILLAIRKVLVFDLLKRELVEKNSSYFPRSNSITKVLMVVESHITRCSINFSMIED